jgi:tetratricopeptide (TPR) repeat protein
MITRYVLPGIISTVLAGGAAAGPLETSEWVVDLGRDYALSPQAGVSDVDGEITLLLMEAATRLAPDRPDPYRWQYELLVALRRPELALDRLEQYVRLDPADEAACLQWAAGRIEAAQTAEERANRCRELLARPELPPVVASDLHRRLAEFHYNRRELDAAGQQARQALALDALNLAARQLLIEMSDAPEPVKRANALLAQLAVNPADANAAWELGNMLKRVGLADEAGRWYAHAEAAFGLVPPGEPPELFREEQARDVAAELEAPAELRTALASFPDAILDYPFHPDRYLKLELLMSAGDLPPTEPWRCSVRMTNTGSFPITLGEGGMVLPELLCAVMSEGDQARTSGPTLYVSLRRRLRLMAGDTIEVARTLDVGPIRSAMIGTPQVLQRVEVAGVLSPVLLISPEGQESWAPGIGGVLAEPARFRRSAYHPTAEGMNQLSADLRTGSVTHRIAALELLTMLLAEHQHLKAGRLSYRARPIDAAAVESAILGRLADEDYRVRARLAECLRWFVLSPEANTAATRLLRDPHWLVRGLTLRALADHHGTKVQNILEAYAKADPDEWPRRLASALLARMAPATRPANGIPATSP